MTLNRMALVTPFTLSLLFVVHGPSHPDLKKDLTPRDPKDHCRSDTLRVRPVAGGKEGPIGNGRSGRRRVSRVGPRLPPNQIGPTEYHSRESRGVKSPVRYRRSRVLSTHSRVRGVCERIDENWTEDYMSITVVP